MNTFSRRRRSDQRVVVVQRATSYHNRHHIATRRRTKQNSANSLDDFWTGLDEAEFARSPVPRNQATARGQRVKQLSSQTAKTAQSFPSVTEEWDIIQVRGSHTYTRSAPPVSEISFEVHPEDQFKVATEVLVPGQVENDTTEESLPTKAKSDTKVKNKGFFRRVFGQKDKK